MTKEEFKVRQSIFGYDNILWADDLIALNSEYLAKKNQIKAKYYTSRKETVDYMLGKYWKVENNTGLNKIISSNINENIINITYISPKLIDFDEDANICVYGNYITFCIKNNKVSILSCNYTNKVDSIPFKTNGISNFVEIEKEEFYKEIKKNIDRILQEKKIFE